MPTLSITVDSANATRVQHALGASLSLGRDATTAEVKDWLIGQMKALTKQQERREAESAVTIPADLVAS
jgi:hypothetical protein